MHILRQIKTMPQYKEIVSFDVETHGMENRYLLCGIWDSDGYHVYLDKQKAIDHLLSAGMLGKMIFATNLQFDFNALFYGHKLYSRFDWNYPKNRLISVTYRFPEGHDKCGGCIRFYDTENHVRASLKDMGKVIGIKKKSDLVKDIIGKRPKDVEEWDKLIEYNKSDCEITKKFMEYLQTGYNEAGGQLKATVSSTAMDTFRRKYMTHNIAHEDANLKKINYKKKILESYCGGRVEIFGRGLVKNRHLYDINSLYPSVMKDNDYPVPETARYTNNPSKLLLEYSGISKVTMSIPQMHIGVLPYRYNNKLIFPTGEITGCYDHEEINVALKYGCRIKKMFWTLYYSKTEPYFKEYMTDLYDKRMEYKDADNKILSMVYKILANSTYGKFAQRNTTQIKIIDLENLDEESIRIMHSDVELSGMGNIQYAQYPSECDEDFIIPIFASHTTALARLKILEYVLKYKADYMDTDSIITKYEVPTSNRLGDMKHEGFLKSCVLIKPKAYGLDGDVDAIFKIKGISGMNRQKFLDILSGKAIQNRRFTTMRDAFNKGIPVNMITFQKKMTGLEDDKRHWIQRFNPYVYDVQSRPHIIRDGVIQDG